jgi:hypothetical protein
MAMVIREGSGQTVPQKTSDQGYVQGQNLQRELFDLAQQLATGNTVFASNAAVEFGQMALKPVNTCRSFKPTIHDAVLDLQTAYH